MTEICARDLRLTVTVRVKGMADRTGVPRDISDSGAVVLGDWQRPAGQEIELALPFDGGGVPARVRRCGAGFAGIVFQQDSATGARVGCAMDAIVRTTAAA